VGRLWDSGVPRSTKLFKTKRQAFEFLSTFVCDVLQYRALQRYEANQRP
jgi:hypothetical protein